MENIGREPTLVHGTLHGPGYSGAQGIGDAYPTPDSATSFPQEMLVDWVRVHQRASGRNPGRSGSSVAG